MKTIRVIWALAPVLITCGFLSAQTPRLSSCPAAKATVFLDFAGCRVNGTSWNWNGPIEAQPANLSSNVITEIYNRIAEDYRPFNLNITTNPAVYYKAPLLRRIRIIFTATSSWYGNAGGVSFTGSFSWGDDTPAWVFTELLGKNPKYIAACASHEIGHTLGLQHQSLYDNNCHKITECDGGMPGQAGWAPIMGVGLYQPCTIWEKGPSSTSCQSIQDDIAIIASQVGFRPDDYSNDYTKAETLNIYAGQFSIKGLINRHEDRDAFRIDLPVPGELQLHSVPVDWIENSPTQPFVQLILLNAGGESIGHFDPVTLCFDGLHRLLDAGTYYFILEDARSANAPLSSRPAYYALSGNLIPITDLQQLAIKK
jgi:hypothetical protein